MAALVHLVVGAEVDNPDRIVSGSTTGMDLSPHGLEQARRVGRYLGPRPVVAIWASPRQSTLRTAEAIASRPGVPIRVHPDLADWSVFDRWEGHPWDSISLRFPGELEAYRSQPTRLGFAAEEISEVAERVAAVARELDATYRYGDVVIVSHPDALQAGRLALTGASLDQLHRDRPLEGAVVSLRPGPSWMEETVWHPGDTPRFGERSGLRVVTSVGPNGPTSA